MQLFAILESGKCFLLPSIKDIDVLENGMTKVYNIENEICAVFPSSATLLLNDDTLSFDTLMDSDTLTIHTK